MLLIHRAITTALLSIHHRLTQNSRSRISDLVLSSKHQLLKGVQEIPMKWML